MKSTISPNTLSFLNKNIPKPPFHEIIKTVMKHYGITEKQLFSKSRLGTIVQARQACWFFIKRKYGLSHEQIAFIFKKERTTVLRGIANLEKISCVDAKFRKELSTIESNINNNWTW